MVDGINDDSATDERDDDALPPLIEPQSRRRFLALMAGGVGATFVSPAELAHAAANRVGANAQLPTIERVWSAQFTRTKDLVDLNFTFVNLTLDGRSPRRLVKQNVNNSAYVIVEFPPQHVAEESLFYFPSENGLFGQKGEGVPVVGSPYGTGTGKTYLWHRSMPLRSRYANPSRLAFEVSPEDTELPYTEAGLLNWSNGGFTPVLVAQADSGAAWDFFYIAGPIFVKRALAAPTDRQTAIEFPYGLVLTPSSAGRWQHQSHPVTNNKRTEVWSTLLRDSNYLGRPETPRIPTIDFGFHDPSLRAVWTRNLTSLRSARLTEYDPDPDYRPVATNPPTPELDPPFVTLPSQNDKWQLVGQMTYQPTIGDNAPPALTARKFRMSTLGATVDMSGNWEKHDDNGEGLNLLAYVHRAFAGRDYFVKVVNAGYLYPTLHRAAQVRVMERLFVTPTGAAASTGPVAYLQEWVFLVVRERTRTYGGNTSYARGFPFTEVTINVDSTPPILPSGIAPYSNAQMYFPKVGDDVFRFPCTVTDQVGQKHQMNIPLAFVDSLFANGGATPEAIADAYGNYAKPSFRTIKVEGQRIAFAQDFDPRIVGKTNFPTYAISMLGPIMQGLTTSFDESLNLDESFPRMDFAGISIDSLGGLAGVGKMFAFSFPDFYLNDGFGGNNANGMVFARFLDLGNIVGFDFAGLRTALALPDLGDLGIKFPDVTKIGGLISPNFNLAGLSAALGTFGGEFPEFGFPDIINGLSGPGALSFDPQKWFSGFPKLLGGISLPDILQAIGFGGGGPSGLGLDDLDLDMPEIPGLTSEIIYKDIADVRVPVGMMVKYRWCTTELKDWPDSDPVFEASFNGDGADPKAELCVQVTAAVQYSVGDTPALLSGGNFEASVEGAAELKNFRVNLIGKGTYNFVTLQFSSISFTAKTGADPQVTPNIAKVDFEGALKYIQKLKDYLLPESGKTGGDSGDGGSGLRFTPIFDIDSKHVSIGFDLGIPTIAVGVFSLSNLEVGMVVTLPFNSDPLTFGFHVCRKDRPFLLTVGIFGGGGFFAMELGTSGVRSLEISLEFGAAAQLDVGVASGSVSVMGGIYFAIKTLDSPAGQQQLELTGYVRLNGRLEVLCIITLSLEFLLSLTYLDPPGTAKGRAQLTVTVEVVFFSADVTMEVEKEFGGNSTGSAPQVEGKAAALAPVGADHPVRYADLITSLGDYTDYLGAFA